VALAFHLERLKPATSASQPAFPGCLTTDYDKDCVRDVAATKKLHPGLRDFREYAVAAMKAGKLY